MRNGRQYDVVVVGGGGAGLAAAIEARQTGREVLLLEKNPALGGSTAWSIGSITSSATPHQIAHGIKDCPADHWCARPASIPHNSAVAFSITVAGQAACAIVRTNTRARRQRFGYRKLTARLVYRRGKNEAQENH